MHLICEAHTHLVALRVALRHDVNALVANFHWRPDMFTHLIDLLHDPRLTVRMALAKYIYINVFSGVPMFPAPYMYSLIQDAETLSGKPFYSYP
jgi:hypothetical protein